MITNLILISTIYKIEPVIVCATRFSPSRIILLTEEKAPEEGVLLCRFRINEDILRSHVHYDKAILLLAAIRDIYVAKGNEAKWVEFIRRFAVERKQVELGLILSPHLALLYKNAVSV